MWFFSCHCLLLYDVLVPGKKRQFWQFNFVSLFNSLINLFGWQKQWAAIHAGHLHSFVPATAAWCLLFLPKLWWTHCTEQDKSLFAMHCSPFFLLTFGEINSVCKGQCQNLGNRWICSPHGIFPSILIHIYYCDSDGTVCECTFDYLC